MQEIIDGIVQAAGLIATLNPDVMEITGLTISISIVATLIGGVIAVPLGGTIATNTFPGKRGLVQVIQTLYAVPTVTIGLLLFLIISRAGPLGQFQLLFTPAGMVIGDVLLILPIVTGMTFSALANVDRGVHETLVSLGATRRQLLWMVMKEARFAILAAVALGFGRAISEVGCAIMIGGNIRGSTRVLTTAISLETSMGNIGFSIALGVILLLIALAVNLFVSYLQGDGSP